MTAPLTRYEIPDLLVELGLVGKGAEVGVRRGQFSEHILSNWPGQLLYSIDPWLEFPRDEYVDSSNVPQAMHDTYFSETLERMSRFGERSKVLRLASLAAAKLFDDEVLDFVYIDAQHHFDAVLSDIEAGHPRFGQADC